jgi:hypothetical protein
MTTTTATSDNQKVHCDSSHKLDVACSSGKGCDVVATASCG